jgi:hypothetical protein
MGKILLSIPFLSPSRTFCPSPSPPGAHSITLLSISPACAAPPPVQKGKKDKDPGPIADAIRSPFSSDNPFHLKTSTKEAPLLSRHPSASTQTRWYWNHPDVLEEEKEGQGARGGPAAAQAQEGRGNFRRQETCAQFHWRATTGGWSGEEALDDAAARCRRGGRVSKLLRTIFVGNLPLRTI